MITRIVKLTFDPTKVSEFLSFLEEFKTQIRNFPGCEMLEFLQEVNKPNVIMTHSQWQSEKDLEDYRNSELFNHVWANTKIHFIDKPEAITLNILDKL
jgi:(4S)-4-hydroxy-5-phosphonooxypentane-2,3-dione isomerase